MVCCCSATSTRAKRAASRRSIRSPRRRTTACRPSRGCRPTRARTCASCARSEDELLEQLRLGRQERRRRPDPDRRGDEADAASADCRREQARSDDDRRFTTEDTKDTEVMRSVLRVLCVLCVLCGCSRRVACARRWPARRAAGYKREAGMPSSALPAPLREIGFDQNLDRAACRSTRRSATRPGATVRLGDYFGKRPVVLVFAYYDCPMLCTQVINGLASALGRAVARRRARTSRSSRSASIRATRRRPRPRRRRSTCERYKRPGAADGWHFLTGDQPSIDALTQGRRLPLRLGRGHASSSRTRPASSC